MKIDFTHKLVSEISVSQLANHVFPCVAMFETSVPPTPYAVYQRTGTDFESTKGLFTGNITHRYSITVYTDNYDDAIDLANVVINRMLMLSFTKIDDEGFSFGAITVVDVSEDFIDGIFYETIQFEINTKEIMP